MSTLASTSNNNLPIKPIKTKKQQQKLVISENNANKESTITSADVGLLAKVLKLAESKQTEEEKIQVFREVYEYKLPASIITEDKDLLKAEDQKLFLEQFDKENPEFLKEWNLSWAGKLFFASAAAYIAGKVIKNMPLKIKGTKQQLDAIANVIVASKSFQDELKKPGATIESVVKKLNLRNMSRNQFRNITGKDFPL